MNLYGIWRIGPLFSRRGGTCTPPKTCYKRRLGGPGAGARLDCRPDELPRRVSLPPRVWRGLSADPADLPMPAVRRSARGRARHGRAPVARTEWLDETLRRPLQTDALALRLGRLGQARVGRSGDAGRSYRVDGRR